MKATRLNGENPSSYKSTITIFPPTLTYHEFIFKQHFVTNQSTNSYHINKFLVKLNRRVLNSSFHVHPQTFLSSMHVRKVLNLSYNHHNLHWLETIKTIGAGRNNELAKLRARCCDTDFSK